MPNQINYATQYGQALAQAFPYVLNFGRLYATPNNGRYRVTGAKTIEIPTISTTGRVAADRDTIATATRNYDNAWEPKTLKNQRKWSTLVHPMDIDQTNMVASIQNITQVFNEEQKFPEIPADELNRQLSDVMVEDMVKKALIRLNPVIAEEPSRADEVIYKLRGLILSVQPHNLVAQNEAFRRLVFEENTFPFGENGRAVPIRFFGAGEDLEQNEYVVTNQWVFPRNEGGKRLDIVLLMDEEALSKFKEVVESVVYYTVINRITTNITERTFASWCSEIRRITSAESLDAFVARAVIPTVTSWKQDNQSNFMRLGLNSMQQYRIKFILGKITAYVDALRQGTSTVRDVTPYVQSTVEIEHIMPQTCYDKGQYGLSEEEYPVYLNRLGNLTLLENSINKSIQNEGYEAKAKAYKQSKFYLTSALSELTDQGSQTAINRTNKILRAWTAWDKGSIEDRQLLLYELSERIWSITKKQES